MSSSRSAPIGHFLFDAKGTPARAVLHADGTWAVLPVEGSPAPPLADFLEEYLNTLYGPGWAALLPAGMGCKSHRLFHAALADLRGSDAKLRIVADPPGRVH